MVEHILTTAVTVILTLTLTLIFNKVTGLPKKKKLQQQEEQDDIKLCKRGIQVLLKNELKVRYDYWLELGYAPEDAKDDLEKEYQVYHAMGKNGVMDSRRAKFLELPNELEED